MRRLERRVVALEGSAGDEGGCERCCGVLVTVSHAITGEHHSATWNGEAISQGELLERQSEARCPRCGRKIDQAPVIGLNSFR